MRLKLSFLVHDLRTFNDNPEVENRLKSSTSLHHIGPPYLTDLEATEALATSLGAFWALSKNFKHDADDQKTLGTYLDDRMQKIIQIRRLKWKDGGEKHDFVLCTSHDLEPMMKTALCLEWGFGCSNVLMRIAQRIYIVIGYVSIIYFS